MNLDKISHELEAHKFSYMTSEDWPLNRKHPDAWQAFTASWDRLPTDKYMKNGDTFRERRFCKYGVDPSTMTFRDLDDYVFQQSSALNSYAGGVRREFAPVEPSIRENRVLREIIETCLTAIRRSVGNPPNTWKVYVHQFRIHCSTRMTGQPTPEGMHRDGHDFISMHLMNRHCIEGGVSTLCDAQDRTVKTVTLKDRMDGFLVNDRALRHGVSQITPFAAEAGHRDMLVIDYNCES